VVTDVADKRAAIFVEVEGAVGADFFGAQRGKRARQRLIASYI
jgi:hypothetical protein